MGVRALLVIVGTRLQDELVEKTEAYRTFRHPRAPGRPSLGRNAEIPLLSAKGCSASRYLRKISTAWHASIGRACQGAGFHATFSLAAALCDAVWPN
jgi:hypothetical protein